MTNQINLYLDTEFTSLDDDNAKLISIALVANDSLFYYAELSDTWCRGDCSEFVLSNVLPLLENTQAVCRTTKQVRQELRDWINGLGGRCQVFSDNPSYDGRFLTWLWEFEEWPEHLDDHVYLCEVPPNYPDLRRHHALDDARAMHRFEIAPKRMLRR